jgi:molybdate transport system regulatory protein
MKTSARNQFTGTVTRLVHGAVNDEIELRLDGGQTLTANITTTSTERLGLAVGVRAHALIKASSIILVDDTAGFKFSARNQLSGVVDSLTVGAVNSEVTIKLDGGYTVAAIITNQSSETLDLDEGMTVTALFKASAVILAVSA